MRSAVLLAEKMGAVLGRSPLLQQPLPSRIQTPATRPDVTIISAMSENRVIGAGDGMPWDVPEEYERYVETVRGGTVVFGRNSYEIFGQDLDAARLVVVTSQPRIEGVRTAGGLEEAIEIAGADGGEVFVAGGASIYEQAIPLADRMYLSTIHGEHEGDSRFPEFDESQWEIVRLEEHERFDFREWARK